MFSLFPPTYILISVVVCDLTLTTFQSILKLPYINIAIIMYQFTHSMHQSIDVSAFVFLTIDAHKHSLSMPFPILKRPFIHRARRKFERPPAELSAHLKSSLINARKVSYFHIGQHAVTPAIYPERIMT